MLRLKMWKETASLLEFSHNKTGQSVVMNSPANSGHMW